MSALLRQVQMGAHAQVAYYFMHIDSNKLDMLCVVLEFVQGLSKMSQFEIMDDHLIRS